MIVGKEVEVVRGDSGLIETMIQRRDDGTCTASPLEAGEARILLETLRYTKVQDNGTEQLWQRVDVS